MSETNVLVVLVTFPNLEEARQIATVLIEKQVAKCVNLSPQVESIYEWEGKIEREREVLAFVKTTRERYPKLEELVLSLHPYEAPEVLALEVKAGAEAYLNWVNQRGELSEG